MAQETASRGYTFRRLRPHLPNRNLPMKIERNTSDMLIVGEIPWFVSIATFIFIMAFATPGVLLAAMGDWVGIVIATLGVGLGVAAMGMFAERLQVVLDTKAQIATIRSRTIFRHRKTVFPLDDLLCATTEATLTSSASDPTRPPRRVGRAALVLDDGSGQGQVLHPVTETYSNSGGAALLVNAINDWLENHRSH